MKVEIARLYDPIPGGTYRILVDRLWPRGIKKTSTKVDTWVKEIAPSEDLRKWYGHDGDKAEEFTSRYKRVLNNMPDTVKELRRVIREHKNPILVYAAKGDTTNAHVLQEYLADMD